MTPKPRKPHSDKMKLEDLIQEGENPKGFTSQTANGTAHWKGTGWNDQWNWPREQCEPTPTRPEGPSNRTGE